MLVEETGGVLGGRDLGKQTQREQVAAANNNDTKSKGLLSLVLEGSRHW